jgi:hypothetical protein
LPRRHIASVDGNDLTPSAIIGVDCMSRHAVYNCATNGEAI